jgi:hypothetical protein
MLPHLVYMFVRQLLTTPQDFAVSLKEMCMNMPLSSVSNPARVEQSNESEQVRKYGLFPLPFAKITVLLSHSVHTAVQSL